MLVFLIIIITLIFLSAFFSSAETALTGASLSSITEKAKKGNKSANLILLLLKNKASLIIVLLMSNTFVNIFFSTISTTFWSKYLGGDNYVFFIALINTVVILLFGEILPKTYAFSRPVGFALVIAPIVFIIVKVLTPVTKIFLIINNLFLKLVLNKKGNSSKYESLENLRGAIELFQGTSNNEIHEKEMLHSVLDLDNIALSEIMVHRKNVFCVDINTPNDELIKEIITSNYTKVPVYKDSKDNIIGILYTKEILKGYFKNQDNFDIHTLIKNPKYFPETTNAFDLLIFMQESKEKIIIVVDEYGGFMGTICVSDILEEIVGELKFSHINNIQKIKNSYIVNGDITIRDLNRKLKWQLPDDNATTIAGLILYETGKIPNTGNIFALHNFKFEILEKKKQQIKKIKITPAQSNS